MANLALLPFFNVYTQSFTQNVLQIICAKKFQTTILFTSLKAFSWYLITLYTQKYWNFQFQLTLNTKNTIHCNFTLLSTSIHLSTVRDLHKVFKHNLQLIRPYFSQNFNSNYTSCIPLYSSILFKKLRNSTLTQFTPKY